MKMKGTWRVTTGLLLLWLLILVYMSTSLYQSSDVNERTERQLQKAMQELDALKLQNRQLQSLAQDLKYFLKGLYSGMSIKLNTVGEEKEKDKYEQLKVKFTEVQARLSSYLSQQTKAGEKAPAGVLEPSLEHEILRRKIQNGVKELWFFLNSQIEKLSEDMKTISPHLLENLKNIIETTNDMQMVLKTDLRNLSLSNSAAEWRHKEAKELAELVQSRIHHLQNPSDCSTAKKLVCNLNKGCGFGCQVHHLVYCLIIAYGTKRTMVLDSRGWRYSAEGWEHFFKPLSDTCTDRSGASSRPWGSPSIIEEIQVVDLPIVDSLHPRPPYMPLAIPADLEERLSKLHGSPIVWWIGQFAKYAMRPKDSLNKVIDYTTRRLGFKTPIVGVHVRRTDKVGTEAAFHQIEEYMKHVEEYYSLQKRIYVIDKKRVYLATDDPTVLAEAKSKYKDYEFLSDIGFSRSASLGTRYSEESLNGIMLDIHFLSQTDYLVCTFSSQVCRLAYELMQTLHDDAYDRFYSLDDIYYYGGQNAHNQQAIAKHKARNRYEIDLEVGDLIGVAGNHWDGFSKGQNRRTGRTGLYPSYKVREVVEVANFPLYQEVDNRKKLR